MTTLPIFPLGTALLPGMPLQLQIFEPRYRTMLEHVEAGDNSFGVVLIERGFEVGGGDQRFGVGTVAAIEQTRRLPRGLTHLIARGTHRFEVTSWLPDDPYPRAEVRFLPEAVWSNKHTARLAEVEDAVRRALTVAGEYVANPWPANVTLSDDPVTRAWQLAGIAPVGELDQLTLLRSVTLTELLDATARLTAEAAELWPLRLSDEFDEPGEPNS